MLFALTLLQVQAQESAEEILKKAYKQAKKEKKNVFVKFSASWCGWCKRMDKLMKSDECQDLFDKNYIVVQLVVQESADNKHLENSGGLELKNKYKGKGSGLPFWLIFDKDGNLIGDAFDAKGQNTGSPITKDEVDAFVATLKKTSKLNEKELKVIYDTFYEKK